MSGLKVLQSVRFVTAKGKRYRSSGKFNCI